MNAKPEQPEESPFSCMRIKQTAAFINDELSSADKAEFEAHCEDCKDCRSLVRQFCEVAAVLEARPRYEPDKGLADRVLARVRAEKDGADRSRSGTSGPWRVDIRWVAAAASLVLVSAVSFLVWSIGPKSLPPGKGISPGFAVSTSPADSGEAVGQALDWLAGAQEKSGAWDPVKWKGQKEYESALTGMALLTFLRQPDAATRQRYSNVVVSAVNYLVRQQDAGGAMGPDTDGRMYNHGIAAVALIEAFRTTGDEGLRAAVSNAVAYMASEQLSSGGWGYRKRAGEDANTSISVWQLHALKLANEAGIAGALPAYRRGMRWLGGVMDGVGSFGYQRAGDKPGESDTLTAMGAFCLLGDQRGADAADVAKVRTALKTAVSGWNRETDFYRWYFLVSALQVSGDEQLRGALAPVYRSLLATRNREGANGGTWEPVGTWSSVGGRIFSTAMATLCLEADNG